MTPRMEERKIERVFVRPVFKFVYLTQFARKMWRKRERDEFRRFSEKSISYFCALSIIIVYYLQLLC